MKKISYPRDLETLKKKLVNGFVSGDDPWQTGIKVNLNEKLDAGQDDDSMNDESAGESEHTCSNQIDAETVTKQAETKNHDNAPTDFCHILNKMGLDGQALLFIDSLKAWHPSREDLTNGFILEVSKQFGDSPTIKQQKQSSRKVQTISRSFEVCRRQDESFESEN